MEDVANTDHFNIIERLVDGEYHLTKVQHTQNAFFLSEKKPYNANVHKIQNVLLDFRTYVLLIMEILWFALWKNCCFFKLISPSVASLEDDGKELSG